MITSIESPSTIVDPPDPGSDDGLPPDTVIEARYAHVAGGGAALVDGGDASYWVVVCDRMGVVSLEGVELVGVELCGVELSGMEFCGVELAGVVVPLLDGWTSGSAEFWALP